MGSPLPTAVPLGPNHRKAESIMQAECQTTNLAGSAIAVGCVAIGQLAATLIGTVGTPQRHSLSSVGALGPKALGAIRAQGASNLCPRGNPSTAGVVSPNTTTAAAPPPSVTIRDWQRPLVALAG